jgi:hypothetical protein
VRPIAFLLAALDRPAAAVKAALEKHDFAEVAVSIRRNQLTVSGTPVGRLVAFARALGSAKV